MQHVEKAKIDFIFYIFFYFRYDLLINLKCDYKASEYFYIFLHLINS